MPNNSALLTPLPSDCTQAVRAALAECDISPARPREVAEARALAVRLIGGDMATTETIARVHERSGAGLFVIRENGALAGLLAFLMLSDHGRTALLKGVLDTLAPAPDHVIEAGEEAAGVYSWAIAAANHGVAQSLVRGHERVRHVAAPHLPFYLRPVTPQGRRLAVVRLGFKPLPGRRNGLFWSEPKEQSLLEVAA
jgi:hypothetical protein